MNSLTFDKISGVVSIQDLGRNHAQHLGFSGAGAADEYSYLLANALLGNEPNAAMLEITLGQMSVTANNDCTIVLTGADCQALISKSSPLETPATSKSLKLNQVTHLAKGEQLHLHLPKTQIYSYLAIKNGFDCPTWLESVSQSSNEYPLGFTLAKLQTGSNIHFFRQDNDNKTTQNLFNEKRLSYFHQQGQLTLRFLPSQLWQALTACKQQLLLEQEFTLSPDINRMGIRLKGEPIDLNEDKTLSKPVCFGTIQCPDDGQLIILMKDRQTIGGYPVLGTVIQTDLFRFSQKRPGDAVRFLPISLSQAQAQLLAFREKFQLPL